MDFQLSFLWKQRPAPSASAAAKVAMHRQYNPYASTGSHNYTTSHDENDQLVALGWKAEGVGWYGV